MEVFAHIAQEINTRSGVRVKLPSVPLDTSIVTVIDSLVDQATKELEKKKASELEST